VNPFPPLPQLAGQKTPDDPTLRATLQLWPVQHPTDSSSFEAEASPKDILAEWQATFDPATLLSPFRLTGPRAMGAVEMTPLACLMALWPWPQLAVALAHLNDLGMAWGTNPDVLSGFDLQGNVLHNETLDQALSKNPRHGPRPSLALWTAQARWHQKAKAFVDGKVTAPLGGTVEPNVWTLLGARLPSTWSLEGLDECLKHLLDGGVDPENARDLMEKLGSWWVNNRTRNPICHDPRDFEKEARRADDAKILARVAGTSPFFGQFLVDWAKCQSQTTAPAYQTLKNTMDALVLTLEQGLEQGLLDHALPEATPVSRLPRL
jgi:hypothetical protein